MTPNVAALWGAAPRQGIPRDRLPLSPKSPLHPAQPRQRFPNWISACHMGIRLNTPWEPSVAWRIIPCRLLVCSMS